mmetsp:Transcript_431/g.1111  ORF Transcript_431/g.1111 Transcript_431/m.1111 type:complete len:614 (+) Transcript_431:272-2113(+)
MRRSRKKQNAAAREEQRPPTVEAPVKRQQPPAEVLQQQRKKHHDEVTGLTTKNYRLAKELAELRLKHRDECKNVTRLTMENMNLASRCREAISHVAMLKKELAMQQKRTSQALASQREQTQRMADSLTNSFISFSSPDSLGRLSENGGSISHKGRRVSDDEDDTVMRLVSNTPSPDRIVLRPKSENNFEKEKGRRSGPYSKPLVKSTTARPLSPNSETRDSPATTASNSPLSNLDEDDTVHDSIALTSTAPSESPEKQGGDETKQNHPSVFSTPKKSDRLGSSSFRDEAADRDGLFPFSASPQGLNKSSPGRGSKSYDEEFPSDTIEEPDSVGDGKYTTSQRKFNLMNSIDAFEQSFSTDFPDSFAPKESSESVHSSGSGQRIYNPFVATPEKRVGVEHSYAYNTPKEEKKTPEATESFDVECHTPPKASRNPTVNGADNTSTDEHLPKRPEKITPSSARARYEKALGNRMDSGSSNSSVKSSSSDSTNGATALFRRIQQKKRLDMNADESSSPTQEPRKSILNIVDTFEQKSSEKNDGGKEKKLSAASRFQGPIRSLRRRSVKQPISYAEPALNTKLRQGDKFFPKTDPTITDDGDENRSMNGYSSAAVVSP